MLIIIEEKTPYKLGWVYFRFANKLFALKLQYCSEVKIPRMIMIVLQRERQTPGVFV